MIAISTDTQLFVLSIGVMLLAVCILLLERKKENKKK